MNIYELGYNSAEFFEASGSWTCPADVFEILLIGSGGGGGGGSSGNNSGAGGAGGAGGATTFSGAGITTRTFPGGAGGTVPGINAGGTGGRSGSGIGTGPAGGSNQRMSGRWQPVNFGHLTSFFFPGGNGGERIPSPDSSLGNRLFLRAGDGGLLLNGGVGGDGAGYATSAIYVGGGGGAGGASVGIPYRINTVPNAIYTITIGVGGAGGTALPDGAYSTASGGGGAGGFIAILYNRDSTI
ncbi:MAG: hypothetical protein ACK5YR_16575 [Pirellula sp.]